MRCDKYVYSVKRFKSTVRLLRVPDQASRNCGPMSIVMGCQWQSPTSARVWSSSVDKHLHERLFERVHECLRLHECLQGSRASA